MVNTRFLILVIVISYRAGIFMTYAKIASSKPKKVRPV